MGADHLIAQRSQSGAGLAASELRKCAAWAGGAALTETLRLPRARACTSLVPRGPRR